MTRVLGSKSRVPWHVPVTALVFAFSFMAVAWRLDQAPDIFTDEILYTRAGIRVAREGALVWDSGRPIAVHPPLYFLVEGAYWWITSYPPPPVDSVGDIFALVYHARHLNALFAGLTAAVLYLTGRRLRGNGLGLLLAALFILDPFGMRINRRAMLETMAALLTLSGMAVLLRGKTGGKRWSPTVWSIVAGLLLGGGLLTKELTFTTPLAVLLFGLWEIWLSREKQDRRATGAPALIYALLTVAIAGLTYSLYPLWMLISGAWSRFAEVKWLSLQRLLGLVQLSGWNRPGVHLADLLLQRLVDYGTTYFLLALGAVATLWLLLMYRHDRACRLLAAWGLILYPFYGFVALFGSGNDQFFYLLLVPTILLIGYAMTVLAEGARSLLPSQRVTGWFGLGQWRNRAAALILMLILPYNVARWWTAYGVGRDNAYRQLTSYVKEHVPADEPLNATGDAIKFWYFFPDRLIASAATPEEARTAGVHYFALAPKDIQAQYGQMEPQLATWIRDHGQLLYSVSGDSYGEVFLYRVDYQASAPPASATSSAGITHQLSIQPARGAFVGGLLVALILWSGALGGLAVWLGWRQRASPIDHPLLGAYTSTAEILETEHE